MKITRNIAMLTVLFCSFFACSENQEKQAKNIAKENHSLSEKLTENFGYADSPELNEKQKSILQEYDFIIREPLQKAILESIGNGELPSNIEQTAFNNGFIKSAIMFMDSTHAMEFEAKFVDPLLYPNPDAVDFTADELQSIFIKIIKFGQSEGLFAPGLAK